MNSFKLNYRYRLFIALFLGHIYLPSIAQNFIPVAGSNNTINYPSGGYTHFFDPGGPGGSVCPGPRTDLIPGNYPNCGCLTTMTIVPDQASNPIEAVFTEFGIFAYFDYLIIYDNNTASGAQLYNNGAGGAQYNQRCPGPDTVIATNPSGALTFVFNATTVVDDAGFGFYILNAPTSVPNNAGVTAIVEPSTGCVGTRDVEVEISNNGSNQISSLFVHWSVNGTFQGIVPYTQLLDTLNGTGPNKDTVTLGQVNFVATGNYNIKAWTVNPNNQPDTVNFDDSSDVTLTGINYPVSTLGADTTICPDQPLNLTASSSLPDSVLWGDTSFTFNSRVITSSGLYIAEIYKDGCKTEDSILIGLHPAAPPVNLGNDSAFCYGDILTLDATASGVTYQWQDNSSNATFPADTSGLFWVILETANSCRSYDSITLNLYTDPFINLFASPGTIICYGAPISFIANASTQGSRMFQLVINNANVGSAQSGNFFTNPTVENGDTVRVDLITDQCAANPYSVPSNELIMTVKPKPISINGLTADTVIENTTKNYAVASTGSNSYLWKVFGGSIVGDSTTIAVQIKWDGPNPNAWVSVTETDVTNCSYENILPVNVISIDGISESGGAFLGSAYPNPANESITIPVNSEKPVDITLSIFDLSGKEVLNIFNGEVNGNRNFVMSVMSLDEGMYFYKLVASDGGQMTRKLMIRH